MMEDPLPEDAKSRKIQPAPRDKDVPELLKEAFAVFSKASEQLERSYEELKVRADRLALELARTNEELQHQLEEKERISNFLNNILESITSGIIVVAPDGTVSLTNRSAERMLGFDAGSADCPHYVELLGKSPIPQFLTDRLDSAPQSPRSGEVEISTPEGRHHYALTYSPVNDAAGRRVASLLVIQDITRLKLLEEQALRTQRLAAMGEVAAELAHEIRNPLGSIGIFASLLSRDLKDEANRKLAENIVIGVKSLNAVVSNMLTFTRAIEIHPEVLDVNELVRETFAFMSQVLAAQNVQLDLRLDERIEEIEADPELVKQVLLNLAQNAANAMERGGTLSVETTMVETQDGEKGVRFRVSDTGCGINPELLSRIFDPFFSTRKGGTGLGLSVASQIVDRHGGVISVESEPGKGTAMTFTIPSRHKK